MTTEIERLLVRLVGDGGDYKGVLDQAVKDSVGAASRIQQQAKEAAAQAELLEQSARGIGGGTQAAMQQHAAAMKNLNDELGEGNISIQHFTSSARDLDKALEDVTRAEIAANEALREENRLKADAEHVTDSARNAQERYAEEVRRLKGHLDADRISQETFNRALRIAQQRYSQGGSSIQALGRQVEALGRQMQTLGRRVQGVGATIGGFGRKWSLFVTAPIVAFLGGAAAASMKLEGLKRGLEVTAGSAGEAGKQLAALKEVAKLPGLGLAEAVQGSISLQNAEVSAELATRSMMAFGNALATVNKGKFELQRIIYQLTQTASMGKVMGQEIMLISQQMPQFRKAMRDAFGTTSTEEIKKMGITATQFIEGVVGELEKLPKVAGGVRNAIENFGDTSFEALAKVGKVVLGFLAPALEKAAKVVETLSKWFDTLSPGMQKTIVIVAAIVASIGPLIIVAMTAVTVLGGFIAAIGAIGLPVVAGIVAVAAAISGIAVVVGGAVASIMGVDGLKGAFDSAVRSGKNAFARIDGFLANFRTNIDTLVDWLRENWLEVFVNIGLASLTFMVNLERNVRIGLWAILKVLAVWSVTFLDTIRRLGERAGTVLIRAIYAKATGQMIDFSGFIKEFQTELEAGAAMGMKGTKAAIEGTKFVAPLEGFKHTFDELPKFAFDKAKEAGKAAVDGVKEGGKEFEFTPRESVKEAEKAAEVEKRIAKARFDAKVKYAEREKAHREKVAAEAKATAEKHAASVAGLAEKHATPTEKLHERLADLLKLRDVGAFKGHRKVFEKELEAIKKGFEKVGEIDIRFNFEGWEAGTMEWYAQLQKQVASLVGPTLTPEEIKEKERGLGIIRGERTRGEFLGGLPSVKEMEAGATPLAPRVIKDDPETKTYLRKIAMNTDPNRTPTHGRQPLTPANIFPVV